MSNDFYKKFFENTPKEEEIEKKIEELEANYKNSASYKEYVEQLNALYNDLAKERRNKKLEIGPCPKRDKGVKKILDKKKDFNIKEYTDADRVLEEYKKLSKEDKRNFEIGLLLCNGLFYHSAVNKQLFIIFILKKHIFTLF